MNPTGTSVPIPSFVYTVFLFKKDDMQGRSKAYGTVQDICISKPDIAIYLFHVMVTRIPKRILYALWKNGKSLAVFTPPPIFSQTTLYIKMLSKNAGGGMVINHGHSVEINASRIGKNFHCFQNVTIGTTNSPIGPTIGDNVFVGAGAVIIGNIKIGNNVKIGANAIVTQDLPDNCTVVTKGSCIVRLSGEKVRIDL